MEGNQNPSQIVEKIAINSHHPSQEKKEHEWMNGLGKGRKKDLKISRKFSPVQWLQPELKRPINSGWSHQTELNVPATPPTLLAVGSGTNVFITLRPSSNRN